MNIGAFFDNFKSWLTEFLNNIQAVIFAILPDSPFKGLSVPKDIRDILGYINWIIPFNMISNTLLIWIGAIVIYYGVQCILRWIKSIQ